MFGSITSGAHAYAAVGIETGLQAASPHRLVSMLYEGAMIAITTAGRQMKARETLEKGSSISKAISIIETGLRASLDTNAGGELAHNLDALYGYMVRRLLLANLNNDPAMLDEVYQLLKGLKDSWERIGLHEGSQTKDSLRSENATAHAGTARKV